MNLFDNQFWSQFLAIAKPYWFLAGPEEGRNFLQLLWSWLTLILLLLLLLISISINAFISYVNRDLIDVIEQKDVFGFLFFLVLYGVTLGGLTLLTALSEYLRKELSLNWYQWLMNYTLNKYFQNQAYYKINFQSNIENPDQRISQEIEPIPNSSLELLFVFLEKIIAMIVFLGIIWSISKIMAIIMILYSILGNVITLLISEEGRRISPNKFEAEAGFRYNLTHIRNNVESIAFFKGEEQESRLVKKKFADFVQSISQIAGWQRNLQVFTNGYQSFLLIIPFLTVAPLYFFNQVELGEVSQVTIACAQFAGALSVLVYQFGAFGSFVGLINRYTDFMSALDAAQTQPDPTQTIEIVEADRIALEHLTLQTPDYKQTLVQDVPVSVEPGGLLIVGPSGVGKSSVLRAIAGLWSAGTGHLVRPRLEEMLFLPQSPYLILGTLREQLLYPNRIIGMSDRELEQVLERVSLQDLLARTGGFDAEIHWENVLSLGEQQRLAFARLLITCPRYAILDEATSALDLQNEENLYQQLQQTETTFISVGHRESLRNYHQYILELSRDASWRLFPAMGNSSDF